MNFLKKFSYFSRTTILLLEIMIPCGIQTVIAIKCRAYFWMLRISMQLSIPPFLRLAECLTLFSLRKSKNSQKSLRKSKKKEFFLLL